MRHPGVGIGIGGAGLGLLIFVIQAIGVNLPTEVLIVLGVVAVLMILGGIALEMSAGRSTVGGVDQRAKAGRDATVGGRDAYKAGRDLTIARPQPPPAGPSRGERLRLVRDEVAHNRRRIALLERNREEWNSVRPPKGTPYTRLPAENWNTHGAALGLPQAAHDTVREAYEIANDFNHEMEHWPATFGAHPEPDLEGVRAAFDRAEAALRSTGQSGSHG